MDVRVDIYELDAFANRISAEPYLRNVDLVEAVAAGEGEEGDDPVEVLRAIAARGFARIGGGATPGYEIVRSVEPEPDWNDAASQDAELAPDDYPATEAQARHAYHAEEHDVDRVAGREED